ncbi:hypothetical protein RchiOBHm_Chr3g0468331 [Rosa chinensis]|uniref:Uncharacterized protein n=1 Tax=Rosa chinensis TaxID=74649 RepID=A0A2P6RAI0_ROSCH|nr:hypothetical protein RchiOBHm_Chr3g0468331 [Rosa chinensis]
MEMDGTLGQLIISKLRIEVQSSSPPGRLDNWGQCFISNSPRDGRPCENGMEVIL